MNAIDVSKAKDPDIRNSLPAMQRAAVLARQIAIATNTEIVVARDGKPVRVNVDELRQQEPSKTPWPCNDCMPSISACRCASRRLNHFQDWRTR